LAAKIEFFEFTNSRGASIRAERHERLISVADIEHSPRFQELCRSCPNYGKNLACPPTTPYFTSYVGQARSARIICFRIPVTDQANMTPEQQKEDTRQAMDWLCRELGHYLSQGYKVGGAGHCQLCETCAGESGETVCRKPAERIFSLEAMGVAVGALLKKTFGFSLEWNKGDNLARYMCAVGAVFYDQDQAGLIQN
jgi:predicted metal-binding protein